MYLKDKTVDFHLRLNERQAKCLKLVAEYNCISVQDYLRFIIDERIRNNMEVLEDEYNL